MGILLFLSLPEVRLPREVTIDHEWLEAALHFLGY